MESFKTYQEVNSEKTKINFGISKMQDIYQKRNGAIDEPHRHNYYTVLIIEKAKGLHKIDFNSYDLCEKQIFFVAPGQIHQVIEEVQSQGFVMTFATQFLVENSIPLSFIDSLNLFQNYGETPPLMLKEVQFDLIENFAESIFQIFHSDANMKNLSIGSYLKLILIECNNICSTILLIQKMITVEKISLEHLRNMLIEILEKNIQQAITQICLPYLPIILIGW